MDRIILEVNSELAKSWRKAPASVRHSLEKELEKRIAEEISAIERDDFFALLDKVQRKAAEKGLTQETLEKLLHEDE